MGITNKETDILVRQVFAEMQTSLNAVEEKIISGNAELEVGSIGFMFGKIWENYKLLIRLLKIDLGE